MTRTFSQTMSALRKGRGLSQRRAAADLGISQALLSHYENGAREPGLGFICRACDYYGVSADYLLGRSELPTPEISAEEARLLRAYRRADGRARDMVALALAPFTQDGSSETA